MSYTLHTYLPSYRAWKILIAAAYNNVKIDVNSEIKMGVTNKTPEYLAKNPMGKVPVLDTPQGAIFESNAIARYVARIRNDTELYGATFFESSQIDQWLDTVTNELDPALLILYYRSSKVMPVDDDQYAEVLKDIEKFLTVLDGYLLTRTYLVGNKITLADIVTTCSLVNIYTQVMGDQFASNYINLNRWFQTCVNQPNFAKVIGKVEIQGAAAAPAASEKKQDNKGKKAEKVEKAPKQEKAAEKPAPAAEHGDDDEEESGSKKEKNPLDNLPKSNMILDAVKKLFFEKRPHFDKFFTEFWKIFDAEGYCIYNLGYNYNEDNKVSYMTSNLTAGYIQRLDELRKYAFGVLNVTGKDEDTAPFTISGCFIFRGKEVPAEMRECPDTDYYKLTPININDEAQRKQIEAAFAGSSIDGLSVIDRKYFK